MYISLLFLAFLDQRATSAISYFSYGNFPDILVNSQIRFITILRVFPSASLKVNYIFPRVIQDFYHFSVVLTDSGCTSLTCHLSVCAMFYFYPFDVGNFLILSLCSFVSYCDQWYFFSFVLFFMRCSLINFGGGRHRFWEFIFCLCQCFWMSLLFTRFCWCLPQQPSSYQSLGLCFVLGCLVFFSFLSLFLCCRFFFSLFRSSGLCLFLLIAS